VSDKIQDRPAFQEWAVVEVMGRLKIAGRVTEATLFGTALCRVDIYPGDAAEPVLTRMFGGSAIYCVTPCTEATARAFALGHQPEPVARWELPAPRESRQPPADASDDERFEPWDDDEAEDDDER
jgi:hypothetical protein